VTELHHRESTPPHPQPPKQASLPRYVGRNAIYLFLSLVITSQAVVVRVGLMATSSRTQSEFQSTLLVVYLLLHLLLLLLVLLLVPLLLL
jgi:hypothetical protein